jgi:hypothetical protein
MITLQQDGKKLAKIELVDGKLKIDYTDKVAADDILNAARYIGERELTDEEVYQTMPARYHGRIGAAATGKVDGSIYERIKKEVGDAYLSRPDVQANIKASEERTAAQKKAR